MDTVEVILSMLVVVIIIVSLLSNVLVLICFLYNPEIRKQVPGLFNLNLTFCNLLLTVSNMPLTLVGLISKAQPGGDGFCQIVGFLETFLSTNSMLSMAALSIDRWIAVVFPLRYHSKMRHKDAAFVLGYTWAHSMSFSTVATCLSWVGYHRLYASCTLSNPRSSSRTQFVVFTVFFHSFTFLLSFIVLCVTYLKVLKVARFHCKRIDVITMQTLVLLVDIHPRWAPLTYSYYSDIKQISFLIMLTYPIRLHLDWHWQKRIRQQIQYYSDIRTKRTKCTIHPWDQKGLKKVLALEAVSVVAVYFSAWNDTGLY